MHSFGERSRRIGSTVGDWGSAQLSEPSMSRRLFILYEFLRMPIVLGLLTLFLVAYYLNFEVEGQHMADYKTMVDVSHSTASGVSVVVNIIVALGVLFYLLMHAWFANSNHIPQAFKLMINKGYQPMTTSKKVMVALIGVGLLSFVTATGIYHNDVAVYKNNSSMSTKVAIDTETGAGSKGLLITAFLCTMVAGAIALYRVKWSDIFCKPKLKTE